MADTKISALPSATTPLAGTEVLPIVQGGVTDKVSVANLTAGRAVSAASVTTTDGVTATGSVTTSTNLVMSGSGALQKDVNTGFVRMIGGTVANVDPTLTMYGSANGNAGLATYDASSHRLRAIDGTTFLNVATDTINYGNFTQGTAAKGVNFTANTPAAGMTSQLLNAYEEGTWTPAVTSSGGLITTVGAVSGSYTKVGRAVHCFFNIAITVNGTGSGSILIANIPFAPNAANTSQGVFREQSLNGKMGSISVPNTTQVQLQFYDNTYPGDSLTSFVGQITYYV